MTSFDMRFAALCAFLSCLFGVSLSAADEEPYKLSDERIETINTIIAKSVADKEDLTNPAVIQAIYKRIGAEMPLTPQEPVIQVDLKKLNEEAHVRTLKKFKADPEKLKARYAAEAEEKFPMAKIRDKVTVVSKRGAVSGVLYKINNSNILVGARTISFIDMDRTTRGRFDPQYNKDLRDQYVQERLNDYVLEFNSRQQQIFESLLTAANGENEKNGYIFLKRSEAWKTAQEIASAELAVETVRYRKFKEKQERIRRKREAKELAAREAKEKAEAEAAAASSQAQNAGETPAGETGTEIPPDQIKDNPFALPSALDGEKTAENADPQDVLNNADSSANVLQPDEGGTFIALTPEQLAALSRPKVNETAYKALMARIEKEQNEINSKYFGIDADQGFKKALWGFRETDVYYALSKETDAAFIKKLRINRNDILYPEGSRPQKIYLHYHLGELYKVQIFMGDLKQHEFNIYKNSLVQKYGKSDTEKQVGDDVFLRLVEGTLSPDDLPKFTGSKSEEGADANEGAGGAKSEEQPAENNNSGENAENSEGEQQENSGPAEKPYFFVWEGILSRGVLYFYYNRDAGIYEDVVFEKIYLPLRLKKYQEERQAASQPKPAEAPAPAAPAAE